jgi:two-component system, NtrC family, sensor histidine kinase HydH
MADAHLQEPEPTIAAVTESIGEERTSAGPATQAGAWRRMAMIGAAIVGISGLRFLVDERLFMWQNAVHHLYVFPIMYAALRFGWRGGLFTTAAAAVSYVPHALTMHAAQPFPGYLLSRILALFEFCLAAAVIGVLSERDHHQRRTLEQTTKRLSQVYYQLQGSFERMKRSERLYAAGELSAGLAPILFT